MVLYSFLYLHTTNTSLPPDPGVKTPEQLEGFVNEELQQHLKAKHVQTAVQRSVEMDGWCHVTLHRSLECDV